MATTTRAGMLLGFVVFLLLPLALAFVPSVRVVDQHGHGCCSCMHMYGNKPYLQLATCGRAAGSLLFSSSSSNNDNDSSSSSSSSSSTTTSTSSSSTSNNNMMNADFWEQTILPTGKQLLLEVKEIAACFGIVVSSLVPPKPSASSSTGATAVTANDIVQLCDDLDEWIKIHNDNNNNDNLFVSRVLQLRRRAMEFQRYEMLVSLLKTDYDAYVATAGFLSPHRIPRLSLPNVQDVPYYDSPKQEGNKNKKDNADDDDDATIALVADCELEKKEFQDNPLDRLLLTIFRRLVTKHTGGIQSDKPGMDGLLEQGRSFMLREGQTPEAQHEMVQNTLRDLMTPILPPFYRIFMSGIVPTNFGGLGMTDNGNDNGTTTKPLQLGPWFYAPLLTSWVTPTFFAFLVGPSYPNRRKSDGQPGGLVVEKCKFLQESNCKGLCLHQCKLPAQQFFQETLGLPLTVSPNFVTQECQWSFGEVPTSPKDDPSFPQGCLVGCQSRMIMISSSAAAAAAPGGEGRRIKADICNY